MRVISLAVAFSIAVITNARAAEIHQFNLTTVKNTVQCEVGLFGYRMRRARIPREKQRAEITITSKESTSTSGGFNFLLAALFGGQVQAKEEVIQLYDTDLVYNIHPDNRAACKKRNRIPNGIGVYACLVQSRNIFAPDAQGQGIRRVTCSSQFNVSVNAGLNAKFPIYIVTVGPTVVHEHSSAYTVATKIPAGKE